MVDQHYLKMGRDFIFPEYAPKYPRDVDYRLRHYRLELDVNVEERSIVGRASILVSPATGKPLEEFSLDACEMLINYVRAGVGVSYDYDGALLRIKLDKPLESDTVIEVGYYTKPRKGLYFILPDEHYPDRPATIWTQGEPEYNRYWMPIYDYPNNKCTSELIIKIRKDFTVVSNGVLVKVDDLGEEKRWHWRMDKPHSTYLISFAAGVFTEIKEEYNGVELAYYVPKGREEDASRTFGKTKDMLKFFSEYLKTPYPFKRYSQVCVTEFIVGGMENTTATTLTDLTLHDEHAHQDFSSDPLIAHELAHQWFGDLVTMKDWSHIWLNESFATYLENLYLLHDKGFDEFIYELRRDLQQYLDEYRNRYSRPVVMRVYKYPEELFDGHAYPKGGLILHTLKNLVGEDNFREALKRFLDRFAFSNADTEDLRKVLEEVSGKNLEQFFEQFIYSSGHPALKIAYSWDEKMKMLKLSVKQTQGDDAPHVYTIPLEIVINYGDGEERRITLNLEERESTYYIPCKEKPRHVCIDPEFKVFKTVDREMQLEELVDTLARCRYVNCRLEAAKALGRIGGFKAVEALEKAVLNDSFWGVSATAACALGEVRSDDALAALLRCVEQVKHPKVRNALAEALGNFKERKEAAEALKKILTNRNESYYVRMQTATSLGKLKLEEYRETLVNSLSEHSHNNVITAGALHGLAELGGEESLKIILDHTRLGNPNTVRIAATTALAKFPGRREVYEKLAELAVDRYDRVRYAVVNAAKEMLDPKLLPILDRMAENDLLERTRRGAREAARKIRGYMEKGVEYKALREEIEKVKEENRRIVDKLARLEVKG